MSSCTWDLNPQLLFALEVLKQMEARAVSRVVVVLDAWHFSLPSEHMKIPVARLVFLQ